MNQRRGPVSLAELAGRPIEPTAQISNNGTQSPATPGPSATPHYIEEPIDQHRQSGGAYWSAKAASCMPRTSGSA